MVRYYFSYGLIEDDELFREILYNKNLVDMLTKGVDVVGLCKNLVGWLIWRLFY